ncbi:hypothetical protein GW931_00940 [archaeon]|nr:hypothetical protein [archaeon]PJC45651.1 MAG: hypothetical protein CO037_00370 [Candidatus Pacearchaeota archaeon CG_4_9_14_0_2_um_filter_30_8]
MDKSEIGNFIDSNLKRGLPIEEIRQHLLSQGFFDYDIKEAISKLNLEEFSPKKEEKISPKKNESMEGWDKELPKDLTKDLPKEVPKI